MQVEVVYAFAQRQILIRLDVDSGTTALQAVQQSGISDQVADINFDDIRLGVFSRKVAPDTVLQSGDRVEIYRPLLIDPMQKRRQRVKPKQ